MEHVKKMAIEGGPRKIKGKGGHVRHLTNAFSQSVLFRVHEGGHISRKSEILLLAALVK